MTRAERLVKITWPFVAVVAIGAAFFYGIFQAVPADQPEGRMALLGLVSMAGTTIIAVIAQRLGVKLDQVREQVNGRMSALIEAKTIPDVSRETSRRPVKKAVPKKVAATKKAAAAGSAAAAKKRAR